MERRSSGHSWHLALAVAGGLVLLLLTLSVALAGPAADAAKGKELYSGKFCAQCHGANGEGGFGPALAGTDKVAADFVKQVRTPRAKMPSFSEKQVSDAEIADIADYLKSLPKPAQTGTYAFTAQAGDPAGKVLFIQKGCAGCHRIPPSVAGTKLTADEEIKQVRTPRNRMGAFTVAQISDAEITSANEWLRSLPPPAPRPTATAQAGAAAAQQPPAALPRAGEIAGNALWIPLLGGLVLVAGGLGLKALVARRNS